MIARRSILAGLFVIVIPTPAIIRCAGVLMPVRDRTTPSLAEVIAWRRDLLAFIHAGFRYTWTPAALDEVTRMTAAEHNYRAMGLLPPVEDLGDYCGSGHDIMMSFGGG